ncbi:hypothetical protein MKEN_01446700 [Mycena kentingensis (nom. inval.)]|nr:hypothetical protein MKEN_01446700 [Mycena kentingensis (nom. inval.)]
MHSTKKLELRLSDVNLEAVLLAAERAEKIAERDAKMDAQRYDPAKRSPASQENKATAKIVNCHQDSEVSSLTSAPWRKSSGADTLNASDDSGSDSDNTLPLANANASTKDIELDAAQIARARAEAEVKLYGLDIAAYKDADTDAARARAAAEAKLCGLDIPAELLKLAFTDGDADETAPTTIDNNGPVSVSASSSTVDVLPFTKPLRLPGVRKGKGVKLFQRRAADA